METAQDYQVIPHPQYIVGLDVGSASLGWACIELANFKPFRVLASGVRIFEAGVDGTNLEIKKGKDQSKAVERRQARLQRRQLRRRIARQRELFSLLQRRSLLPRSEKGYVSARSHDRHEILSKIDARIAQTYAAKEGTGIGDLPIYFLRKRSLDYKLEDYELGRVFFHLSQRRGFKSNRKEDRKSAKRDEDLGQVKQDIHTLEREISAAGARTLGEYLSGLNPHEQKVRRRWTARKMFEDEFAEIWTNQQRHHPELLTEDLRQQIATLLFFQRPVAKQEHLVGRCELEPSEPRAPISTIAAQRFRVLQKVNDLRLVAPSQLDERALTPEERQTIFDKLEREGDQKIEKLLKLIGAPKGSTFNLARTSEIVKGNRTVTAMLRVFGSERWASFVGEEKNAILRRWRKREDIDLLKREMEEDFGLTSQEADSLARETPEEGYASLSSVAIRKLLPLMQTGISFKTAEQQLYGNRQTGDKVYDFLPPVREFLTNLRNPAVERSLTELRKVVNAIIREYGKPYEVRVELARELKEPRQERAKAFDSNQKRRKEREAIAYRILQTQGQTSPTREQVEQVSRTDIEKALLHAECGGICPYTARSIPFSDLFHDSQFDIEHIIPRSRFPDDSFQNKTLCYLPENRERKRNKTPWEAYSADEWEQIINRIRCWPQPNRGKLDRFLLTSAEEIEGFSTRQLNDTRYTSVLASRLLGSLYGGRDVQENGLSRQVVFVSSGKVTQTLRKSWGLEAILRDILPNEAGDSRGKPRSDHRHHAIDAITVALTRQSVIQMMAQAASAEPWQAHERTWRRIQAPWPSFVDSIRPHIEQMVASHRPEHRLSGELHKGTNYGKPRDVGGQTIVTIRCPIEALSAKDILSDDCIIDPAVRKAIQTKLIEIGGDPKAFSKPDNIPFLESRNGQRIPIRRVRIRESRNPLQIGQGPRERYVASGGIHHVAFFVTRDSKRQEYWDSRVVQITQAYERRRNKQPIVCHDLNENSETQFIFSLMKDDTIAVDENGIRKLLRVKKFGDNKQVWFVPINDAHDDKAQKALGIMWSKKPSTLRALNPSKITVDLLGRVHPAND